MTEEENAEDIIVNNNGDFDAHELSEKIKRRIGQKMASGFYDEREVQGITDMRITDSDADTGDDLDRKALEEAINFLHNNWDVTEAIPAESPRGGLKGKLITAYKKFFLKFIQPTINISLARQAELNAKLVTIAVFIENSIGLKSRMSRLEIASDRFDRRVSDIEGRTSVLSEKVAELSNTLRDVDKQGIFMRRKITKLLDELRRGEGDTKTHATEEMAKLASYDYVLFENLHRGTREEITKKAKVYAEWFAKTPGDVLDVGCGRGELLEVFKASNITATGVDINDEMIEECTQRGLTAESGDALDFLHNKKDGELGGISAVQFIEHLPNDAMVSFFQLAYDKLASGGVLAAETINPTCLTTFSGAFYLDMTHVKPVHPLAVQFLLERIGFDEVRIEYLNPYPDDIRLIPMVYKEEISPFAAQTIVEYNRNVEKLNSVLFTHADYAIIAKK